MSRPLALAGAAVLSTLGLAATTPLWGTAACAVAVLALVPALEGRRPWWRRLLARLEAHAALRAAERGAGGAL